MKRILQQRKNINKKEKTVDFHRFSSCRSFLEEAVAATAAVTEEKEKDNP